MKFKKILHYVKKSYRGKPSFIIRMSDGKDYISNGCVFTERTEANIKDLISRYDCKKQLGELFQAPAIAIEDLMDGSFMFYHSPITEFDIDMPKLEDSTSMFRYSTLKSFTGDMPKLVYGVGMFKYSQIKSFKSYMPSLKDDHMMFYGCTNLNNEVTQ